MNIFDLTLIPHANKNKSKKYMDINGVGRKVIMIAENIENTKNRNQYLLIQKEVE